MRVLIFHGYLLGGTGSNVYNANLAAALRRLGHEVHLLCQERAPERLPFVDAYGDWDGGALALTTRREPVRCTVYRPALAGLLPVYVADRYDGIEARPYPELSDAEVEAYVEANVRAVREVAERVEPDVALANHLVMGPLILSRALPRTPYAVKIHGSALEYTVAPHPDRFLLAARRGIGGARGVLVGSRHTAERLWDTLQEPDLPGRTRLGPPGVDVGAFAPREPAAARAGLHELTDGIGRRIEENDTIEAAIAETAADSVTAGTVEAAIAETPGDAPSAFARDEREALRALQPLLALAPETPLVGYVGKLIVSKGVDLLLAAWPLVLAEHPDARLVVVGFGSYRAALERLQNALAAGDLDAVAAIAAEGAPPRAARRGARCGCWPSSSIASPPIRPRATATWRPPRSCASGSSGPAGWSTTSCATCCRRSPPRSSPAPSRRPSGWSPPRQPPVGRCRSAPTTPGWRRSPARSPTRHRRRWRRCSPSRWRARSSKRWRGGCWHGSAPARRSARGRVRRSSRRCGRSGRGRGSRAA